jgi:raffinose/stachyose/melibiose transport system permease protein
MRTTKIRKANKANIVGYLYIAPALLFFVCFIAYSIVFVMYGSLFNWSTLNNMIFVGYKNYAELFKDSVFWKTIENTVFWIILTVFVQMIIGGAIAYAIEEHLKHLKGVFRTLFFLPVVSSVTVIAIVWTQMYSPYQGIISTFLNNIGIKGVFNWMGDLHSAIFSIIVINIWEWMGFSMLMYIAGLHDIPDDIREAARMDGASGPRLIWNIFIPCLAQVHKSLILLGIIGGLQTFALVYSTTGGGPDYASEMPGTYIFREGFTVQRMGYASTISVCILILALILTVLQISFFGSGNFFGGKEND